jgi:hypothetical protein
MDSEDKGPLHRAKVINLLITAKSQPVQSVRFTPSWKLKQDGLRILGYWHVLRSASRLCLSDRHRGATTLPPNE